MSIVIVPTDFSDNAKKAANYAMALYDESAEIHLVNAFQIPHSGATMLISLNEILEKDAMELLEEEKLRLQEEFGSSENRIKVFARLGEPETVIRKYVEENNGDLIVMGTQGATGLKSLLIGSVASAILERSKIPVLAIPEASDLELPTSIAFAADKKGLETFELPESVGQLAKFYSAEVHVVNILVPEEDESQNDMPDHTETTIDLIDGLSHTYHFIKDEDVARGLDGFLNEQHVSLLALVNRKHDLFSRLFNQSITKKMMLHSRTPILAIPVFESE